VSRPTTPEGRPGYNGAMQLDLHVSRFDGVGGATVSGGLVVNGWGGRSVSATTTTDARGSYRPAVGRVGETVVHLGEHGGAGADRGAHPADFAAEHEPACTRTRRPTSTSGFHGPASRRGTLSSRVGRYRTRPSRTGARIA
jgi:hypothetical protein